MSSVSLTGSDTIQIDNLVLNDLADGDCAKLEFDDDLASMKVGKNGNTIFALNEMGKVARLTLRVLLGSSDDLYLNSRMQEMKNDLSSFILLEGTFSKRVGDGAGNVVSKIYQCSGGIFKKQPGIKTSAEGDTEQSVAEYLINFHNDNISNQ